jgi:hypothetical protein
VKNTIVDVALEHHFDLAIMRLKPLPTPYLSGFSRKATKPNLVAQVVEHGRVRRRYVREV